MPGDVAAIREVNEAAFGHALEADIVDNLRANGKAVVALVAVVDGRVVAHVLFSPATIEPPHPSCHSLFLGPLAVHPEHQWQGIGSSLVKSGLEECRRLSFAAVFLYGYPSYYQRFGFQPARLFGFYPQRPTGAPDAFQAIELGLGSLAGVSGMVRYQPEFDE